MRAANSALNTAAATKSNSSIETCGSLDISTFRPCKNAIKCVKASLIRRYFALPLLQTGHKLYIAVVAEIDAAALGDLRFHTNLELYPLVAEEAMLIAAIKHAVGSAEKDRLNYPAESSSNPEPSSPASHSAEFSAATAINSVLHSAMHKHASDIHFEPFEKMLRVRFRIDGVLSTHAEFPVTTAGRICSRIKVMAGMDIAEKRRPQDGQITFGSGQHKANNIRVNSIPTIWGEKIVLRLLDMDTSLLEIKQLGLTRGQLSIYKQSLYKQQGLILITGPTGSGKSVSLYSALKLLNGRDLNIMSAENPVEIRILGVNQVQVNERTGLGFANTLRAFLRQDPDVIMIGEIRDQETAEIAVKAAQTGHLVLSTLHTKSAAETITRLLHLGISSYNLASSLTLIIAQRLARKLCPHCKTLIDSPEKQLQNAGFKTPPDKTVEIYRACGCRHCEGGYKGRIAIYEVVPISAGMSQIIIENGSIPELETQARAEGCGDLQSAALARILGGMTSLEEAQKLTSVMDTRC